MVRQKPNDSWNGSPSASGKILSAGTRFTIAVFVSTLSVVQIFVSRVAKFRLAFSSTSSDSRVYEEPCPQNQMWRAINHQKRNHDYHQRFLFLVCDSQFMDNRRKSIVPACEKKRPLQIPFLQLCWSCHKSRLFQKAGQRRNLRERQRINIRK